MTENVSVIRTGRATFIHPCDTQQFADESEEKNEAKTRGTRRQAMDVFRLNL